MTSPPQLPPAAASETVEVFRAFSAWADAQLARAHLIWALALAAFLALTVIGGFYAYGYYMNKSAKQDAVIAHQQAAEDSLRASEEYFAKRALVAEAQVRVDTQVVTRVIETAPKPVLVPVKQPNGIVSEVPMIPAASFDSLGSSCTRLEHDCSTALATKDSALHQLQLALAHGDSLTAAALKKASDVERANFFSKILYGAGGAILGRATCSVH